MAAMQHSEAVSLLTNINTVDSPQDPQHGGLVRKILETNRKLADTDAAPIVTIQSSSRAKERLVAKKEVRRRSVSLI